MSADTGEGAVSRYEAILSAEHSAETKERYQKEAEFLAFYEHLLVLGRNKEVEPNLIKGRTTISVPAFFVLEGHGTNPVNRAALGLLPTYSYFKGYGNNVETRVDEPGLRQVLALPENELQAARKGKAIQFIVASTLGLLDPVAKKTLQEASRSSRSGWSDDTKRSQDIGELVRNVPSDLNEIVVSEVSDIATMVERKGYTDFLDYLVDARQIIADRVATIFAHEAPVTE